MTNKAMQKRSWVATGTVAAGLLVALMGASMPATAPHDTFGVVDPCVRGDIFDGGAPPKICLKVTTGPYIRLLNIVHNVDVVPGEELLVAQSVLLTETINGNSFLSLGVGKASGCETYDVVGGLLECEVIPLINQTVADRDVTTELIGVCIFEAEYSVTVDDQPILVINAVKAGFCAAGEAVVPAL